MGEKIQKIKSVKFGGIKINRNQLYQTLICVFILFLSFGGFQVLKECCLETRRTFAIVTDDCLAKRGIKRVLTYVYWVDGKQYEGKARYSGESIASVGDTCYIFYEVRNNKKSRIVRRNLWGYGNNPVIVKRK